MAAALNIVNPTAAKEGALDVHIRRRAGMSFELAIAFSVRAGITILFGPSGAGKTTLLDCIAGLSTPDSGRITVGNSVLFDSAGQVSVPVSNRKIGYVFQDVALFPHLGVAGNVGYGLAGVSAEERQHRVQSILESLGISSLQHRRPAQLSGGEKQRVALARALVTQPRLLLLDEPLAGLDLPIRTKIADDLRRSIQNLPIPVLYVTHNRDEVFMLGERLLVLEHGRIIARGTPHEVLSAPRSETVAQLAGFENVFNAEVTSIHEERGTMTCRLEDNSNREAAPQVTHGAIELETPVVRALVGTKLRVGISAGDILLATSAPVGLSARNILLGLLLSLERRDAIVIARIDCGVELAVHLTLGARDSLGLAPGKQVWVIVKTHSCHLLDCPA